MPAMMTARRDPNRPRPVVVHPVLHQVLAREARELGYTIQGRLHALLCEHYGRPDLQEREPAAAAAS